VKSTDFYLNTDNVYARLRDEYLKYGGLIIACDFDDTLYDFHKKGRSYNDVIELLRRWRPYAEILITSCVNRTDTERIRFIHRYLRENEIPYDKVNQHSAKSPTPEANKLYYNVLLDDRAGLRESYEVLLRLITEIENGGLSDV